MNIIEALDDPQLLGRAIKDRKTFMAWRTLFKALFGLPMSAAEMEIFKACTGLSEAPTVNRLAMLGLTHI